MAARLEVFGSGEYDQGVFPSKGSQPMNSTETILGLPAATYLLIHVLISLVGIASGLVVLFGLIGGKRLDGMTALFLTTTVLTSVTGFFFPFHGVTPAIKLGVLSLVVLAIAIVARYALNLAGPWRTTYVISAMIALYFNCFVDRKSTRL